MKLDRIDGTTIFIRDCAVYAAIRRPEESVRSGESEFAVVTEGEAFFCDKKTFKRAVAILHIPSLED